MHTNQQQKTFLLKLNRPRLIDPKKQINTLANETPTAALPTSLTLQGASPGLCLSPAVETPAMPLPVGLGCPCRVNGLLAKRTKEISKPQALIKNPVWLLWRAAQPCSQRAHPAPPARRSPARRLLLPPSPAVPVPRGFAAP